MGLRDMERAKVAWLEEEEEEEEEDDGIGAVANVAAMLLTEAAMWEGGGRLRRRELEEGLGFKMRWWGRLIWGYAAPPFVRVLMTIRDECRGGVKEGFIRKEMKLKKKKKN